MKKEYVLAVLFFSGAWGASEAVLGGFLYNAGIRHASIPLTIIAFIILGIARVYLPRPGFSSIIGLIAMLYKFLNTPFYACHLLAIGLLGIAFDIVFTFAAQKNKALNTVVAVYLGHVLFALIITYVVRYHYWVDAGVIKIIRYIGINGTITAAVCAVIVPRVWYAAQNAKLRGVDPFASGSPKISAGALFLTAAVWIIGIAF